MTSIDQRETLSHWIERQRINIDLAPIDASRAEAVKWGVGAHHWLATMSRPQNGQLEIMNVRFHHGPWFNKEAPSAANVLNALARDAAGFEDARDFDDWLLDMGDTERDKAWETYKAVDLQTNKLRAWLGEALFEELLNELDLDD